MTQRKGEVRRESRETSIVCEVLLGAAGPVEVESGLPFLDHMLEQVARFGGFSLRLKGAGDVDVDPHHLVEDAGITLGQALSRALGERAGIRRFASAYVPLDESLSRVVVDLGGRPYLAYNLPLRGRIGTLEAEVLEGWWRAFSVHLGATIHVDLVRGRNRHHIAESAFKALGMALSQAVAVKGDAIPSSKGMLD